MKIKILLLAMIAVLVLFINLGFWQIRRYHEKQNLLKTYARQTRWQPLAWTDFLQAKHKQYRRINAQGYFVNQSTFLLDNRWYNDTIGYEVLTPFKVLNQNKLLLVNRGWIAAPMSRKRLPEIAPVEGKQSIKGYVTLPSKHSFLLGKNIETSTIPQRIQQIRIKDIEKFTHQNFYPYLLRLAPGEPNGFVREWQLVTIPPDRHLGYAVQWFAMAFVLVIVALIFLRVQRRRVKQ